MTFADLIDTATGNLLRMKVRTSLTITGVIIAVSTLVTMLSFGAGNEAYIAEQFEKLGLLHTMQAFPKPNEQADSLRNPVLDAAAIQRIAQLPGVRVVFPFDAFAASATCQDSQFSTRAQAVSRQALETKWFSQLSAGASFSSDSAREALVTPRFLDSAGVTEPDSIVGKSVVLSVKLSSVDSGIAQVFPPERDYVRQRIDEIRFDSIRSRGYLESVARTEMNNAMARFMDGLLQHRRLVQETLTITGVLAGGGPYVRNLSPVLVTAATASRMRGGLTLDDPAALMGMLTSGSLFPEEGKQGFQQFSRVTIDVEPTANQEMLADSIEALGFRSFSFAEQFREIRQFFVFFDLGLAVIGLIALATASLGIINTMLMSVLERKREIGVLISLGAQEKDIRNLFLTESAMIGLIGSAVGLLVGWGVSRLISTGAQIYMEREGLATIDLFALPLWLVGAALAVGTVVSLVAGFYPATRAARVDPVEALRGD